MDLEKTVKDLQAQNSQFQQTILALANGQQDMMAFLAVKKKPKKKALLNMGRRFKETIRQIPVGGDSSEEDENQIGECCTPKFSLSFYQDFPSQDSLNSRPR